MLCKCVNVKMGSYDNQVELPRPKCMSGRTEGSSNPHTICVDKCIAEEIQYLWSCGIRTTGCCCGHNIQEGYIGVIEEDIKRMKKMDYIEESNKNNFIPKSHWDWDGNEELNFDDYYYAKVTPLKTRRINKWKL